MTARGRLGPKRPGRRQGMDQLRQQIRGPGDREAALRGHAGAGPLDDGRGDDGLHPGGDEAAHQRVPTAPVSGRRLQVPAQLDHLCVEGLEGVVEADLEAEYLGASDEHGLLKLQPSNRPPRIGDKIRLIPGHCDPTVNMYDWYVGVRAGRVETVWPIAARGAIL